MSEPKITFKKVEDHIKSLDSSIENVRVWQFEEFMREATITRKGQYRVVLEFDAKEILKDPTSLPRGKNPYVYVPRLLFIKFKEEKK